MTKTFLAIVSVLSLATARGSSSKFVKTAPTITSSLVNLGKMDISIYFNGKNPEDPTKPVVLPPNPITRAHAMEVPCPCTFKNSKELSFLSNPSEIINKILKSNDLFKDPSFHCCDSHEQLEEDTIFFELGGLNRAPITINNSKKPKLPFPFSKNLNPPSMMRPKAMEILLFPKLNLANMDFKKQVTRTTVAEPIEADIQIVGDKEIKPLNEGSSVKKDLTSALVRNTVDAVATADDLNYDKPFTTVNNTL